MSTIGKFDFEEDSSGITLVAITDRLSASCVRPEEIDWAGGGSENRFGSRSAKDEAAPGPAQECGHHLMHDAS
jgi:hypothetical protein